MLSHSAREAYSGVACEPGRRGSTEERTGEGGVRRQGVRRKGGRKSKDLGGCYMQRLSQARESNGVGSPLCRRPLLWSNVHHRSRVLPPERALLVSLSGSLSSRLPLTALRGPRILLCVCVCVCVCACVRACVRVRVCSGASCPSRPIHPST